MYWPEFAVAEPELAERGWTLLAEDHGYVFLATVARDGGPRLHPVVPIRSDRGLIVGVKEGSPKLADLRRQPRMALHTTVFPPADEEFAIRGIAHEIHGAEVRAAAVAGAEEEAPPDVMVLFEIELVAVGWATWEDQARPTRKRWRAS